MPASRKTQTGAPKKSTTRSRAKAVPVEEPDSYNPAATGDVTVDKYAVTGWGGSSYEDVKLPSGQLCLARRTTVEGLLKAGIIHDLDPFQGMIQQHEKRMAGKATDADSAQMMQALLKDKSKMTSMFHMLDRVLCYISIKPTVHMTPNDPTRRENGKIYADMVDLPDKVYLMSWAVGKVDDLAQFHGELSGSVDSVQAGEVDEPETQ